MFKRSRHWSLSWAWCIQSISSRLISLRSRLILSPSTSRSSKWSPSFRFFWPKFYANLYFLCVRNLCSSLTVRVQVSHPYIATGKFVVLYILIFRRTLNKMVETFSECRLLVIYTWIQFYFVIVVPKYLNIATFSTDLLAVIKSWFCPAFWWQYFNLVMWCLE